jgi:hypothetical protein
MITVHPTGTTRTPDEPQPDVSIHGSRIDGIELFHDINRILSLLDDVAPGWEHDAVATDVTAYQRLHRLAEDLQRALKIEP